MLSTYSPIFQWPVPPVGLADIPGHTASFVRTMQPHLTSRLPSRLFISPLLRPFARRVGMTATTLAQNSNMDGEKRLCRSDWRWCVSRKSTVQPARTSPGRWGLARGLPEGLAQVRLVGEAAPQRDVTQGRIGRQHVLSGEFHATSNDEGVR